MKSRTVMSSKERKILNEKIKEEILAQDRALSMEVDAMLLWVLHTLFGFGKNRLRRVWEFCFSEHEITRGFYQNDERNKNGWIHKEQLKGIGVDIEEWYREAESKMDKKERV